MHWFLASALLVVASGERTITFSKEDAGKLPIAWKASKTGAGDGSVWKVVADESAPAKSGFVLAQTAKGPNALFNLCVLNDSKFVDGDISVQLKAVQGELDQGGGLVWRYRDADNYYITRYNPLENNLRLYKVLAGKRIQLATKEELEFPRGRWHKVGVRHTGDRIICSLDGKDHLDVKDDAFKEAGKVGLWTKADAQSHFDQLTIRGK